MPTKQAEAPVLEAPVEATPVEEMPVEEAPVEATTPAAPPVYDPIENHPELLAELQAPTVAPPFRRFAGRQSVEGRTAFGHPVKIPV